MKAGGWQLAPGRLLEECELREPGDIATPWPHERGVPWRRVCANPQVVLGVRLERRDTEERESLELRQPLVDHLFPLDCLRPIDSSVFPASEEITARQRIVADR